MVTALYSLMRSYISSISGSPLSWSAFSPYGHNPETNLSRRRSGFLALLLLELEAQPQALDFVRQNLERDRRSRLQDVLAPHHRLVDLGAPVDVVRLDGEQLLEDVRRAVGFERPDFHFAEALAARAGLAAQGLLRDQRVGARRAGVDLVVDQVVQLHDVHDAHGDRLVEGLARAAVEELDLAVAGVPRL